MRLSQGFIPTLKEIPSDALIPSHQLMLRAGMIRPLGSGVYSFLPLGYRLMKKVMEIIRDEMDDIGGQEFHLPALNPVELWEETGRVEAFGETMFHIKNRPLILAPTHEEVICSIAKGFIKSYRDMPQIWYQIQTKFRNEPRPRSGVIRGRQFLMKDSYSLDATQEGLEKSYRLHAEAYSRIFTRLGLKFFVVGASSGAMGGSGSQEFMVESDAGEDTCAICDGCGYAANAEVAVSRPRPAGGSAAGPAPEEIATPDVGTIDELVAFLGVEEELLAKSLLYMLDNRPVMILMAGNDQLNETKLHAVFGAGIRPTHPDELKGLTGAGPGSIGPVGLDDIQVYADKRLEGAKGLVSGANRDGFHLKDIDLARDVKVAGYYDFRTIRAGEQCPKCDKTLRVAKAIELGHIFKLGTKYSDAMHAQFLDETGKEKPIIMGSYGIGVERIIACHIEQNYDKFGMVWSRRLSPFHVHLILVNANNEKVAAVAESLYEKFGESYIDTLYDDRKEVSPGFKFKDADLLGMPLQVIVGEKNVVNGKVEVKDRRTGNREILDTGKVVAYIEKFLES
jgi:prolyl-tRNA synthetase